MHSITLADTEYPLIITRRKRARRMVLRFDTLKRHVALTLPPRTSMRAGLTFANSKMGWLTEQVRKIHHTTLSDGTSFPLFGEDHIACCTQRRGLVECGDGVITVPGEPEFFNRRLKDWLKQRLHAEINMLVDTKLPILNYPAASSEGVKPARIQLRETAHHWGSCSSKGTLSFSWRLIFAPYEVLDYLVSHELAHLREMNHSQQFWQLVECLCPDYRRHRNWLKQHGHGLYRYA